MITPRTTASISVSIPFLDQKAKAWRHQAPLAFDRGLEAGIRAAVIDVSGQVKKLLDGPVLTRRSGRLWRSIQPEVFRKSGSIVGIVGTDVEYAAIHEFGGTIRPKAEGGYLVFNGEDGMIFAREVKIPKRPYMSRAFRERKAEVSKLIRDHVMRAVRGELEATTRLSAAARKGVGFA